MKILGTSFDTYGDQVLRQPALTALLDLGHDVTIAMRREYADIVPFMDPRLAVVACALGDDGTPAAEDLERMLRGNPEVVIALPFNHGTADRAVLAAATGTSRIALVDAREASSAGPCLTGEVDLLDGIVDRRIPVDEEITERSKTREIFRAITGSSAMLPQPKLQVAATAAERRSRLLHALGVEEGTYVVMAGLRPDTAKALPAAVAIRTIVWLTQAHGLSTLLTGLEGERELIESVIDAARAQGGTCAGYIGGSEGVGELLDLVAGGRAYVGSDTGTMHFAGALRLPVAALFGGGAYLRFEPDAPRWFATTKRLVCFGCHWQCVYGKPRCIDEVAFDTWRSGVAAVLAGESPQWVLEQGSVPADLAPTVKEDVKALVRFVGTVDADRRERLGAIETLHAMNDDLQQRVANIEADRAERLRKLEKLASTHARLRKEMDDVQADRGARLRAIEELTAVNADLRSHLEAIEEDRAARLRAIEALHAANAALREELAVVESDRAARLDGMERSHAHALDLQRRLDRSEEDRAARLQAIEALDAANRDLRSRLDIVEADRAARLEVIRALEEELRRATGSGSERQDRGSAADLTQ